MIPDYLFFFVLGVVFAIALGVLILLLIDP